MTSTRKRWRRRSSPSHGAPIRKALVIAGCLAAFGVALYAFFVLSPVRLDPAASRAQVEQSLKMLEASNPSAARNAALSAVRSDPNSADAHLALARAQLMLADGIGAEGELRRAIDAGANADTLHHLIAEALLIQGKPDQAIDEVEKTDAPNRAWGLRVRARALTALGNFAAARDSLNEAIRIADDDARVWTDVARFRFGAGDLTGAVAASQRAVELDHDNIDALLVRGQIVRTQFGLVAALPWFEAALKHDPYYHDALIEYAATLGDAGRSVDMLAATRRALAARPGSPQALYLQAVLAARAGNYDLARALVERTGGAIGDLPGMLLLGATLDLDSGAPQQAIEKLRQLLGGQPMNLQARRLLAVALLQTDASRNAIDLLQPLIQRPDADAYSLILAARGYERIGERGAAAQLLDRAAYPPRPDSDAFSVEDSIAVLAAPAAEYPNDPSAVVPLIRALLAKGDRAGALSRAQSLARDNPGAAGSHMILGDVLTDLGRTADAVGEYKLAAALRYDEPVMLRLVQSLDATGRRGEAANALALFLSQNPANVAALRLTAQWQLAGGEFDAAVDTLETLRARIGDRDAAVLADLSAAYAGIEDAETARQYGEAAYALAPASPATTDAYGWALYLSGDKQGAIELLTKAAKLAPTHPGVRMHLAKARAMDEKAPAQS